SATLVAHTNTIVTTLSGGSAMFLDRREFFHQSAGLAGLVSAGYFLDEADAQQPTTRPPAGGGPASAGSHVARTGVRGQGRGHAAGYANRHNCRVTYICDVDTGVMGPAAFAAQEAQDMTPRLVRDFRRALDDRNVHAVSIATPNHWHALAAIWAMQA